MSRILLLTVCCGLLAGASVAAADDVEKAAIAAIETSGGRVYRVAAKSDQKDVSFHLQGSELTDEGLAPVTKVKNVVWLNLRGTKITDAGLQQVGQIKTLTKLHLELTGIGDAGLEHLSGLDKLVYLNLYGTQVGDAGLKHLTGLKQLRRLFLWQTKVTDEGEARLQEALPDLEIVRNVVKFEPPKKDPGSAVTPPANLKPKKTLARGQFVRVSLAGDTRILSLAEVQVLATASGNQLQRQGEANQSSVTHGGVASRATDGKVDQVYANGSVTHSNSEKDPWWQVDLKKPQDIGAVRIFNRSDCCGERLSGAAIEILDEKKKVVWSGKIETGTDGSVHVFQ